MPEADILFSTPVARRRNLLSAFLRRAAELRLERVGQVPRLRVVGPSELALRGPFVVDGASRIAETPLRPLIVHLYVRGADGARLTIGAVAAEEQPTPPRDEWFDGALLPEQPDDPELIVTNPQVLFDLRDALLRI